MGLEYIIKNTSDELNQMFFQDLSDLYESYKSDDSFEFEIQRCFKEFILIYNNRIIPFNKLNQLQFEDDLSILDLMRSNFVNEEWHIKIKEIFKQNGFYLDIIYFDKYVMVCTLDLL